MPFFGKEDIGFITEYGDRGNLIVLIRQRIVARIPGLEN
jgi:hypothetical protein